MNSVEFINDAYTEDNLKLLMVHFNSKEKAKSCNDFEYKYINDTDHFYNGKELEIGNIILNWISTKF